ncbi:hypothetical protein IE53DRAFT_380630 [Violaceomyces palustris]|uniref:Uncharacterized protein n=1 Tax=Violaceomyces palustris TaxID=1673888 RepID=A0ACD0NU25_9BASI|nr:hypothetical protein IE53DRAFT_380630 [Violaceomyces palustris]
MSFILKPQLWSLALLVNVLSIVLLNIQAVPERRPHQRYNYDFAFENGHDSVFCQFSPWNLMVEYADLDIHPTDPNLVVSDIFNCHEDKSQAHVGYDGQTYHVVHCQARLDVGQDWRKFNPPCGLQQLCDIAGGNFSPRFDCPVPVFPGQGSGPPHKRHLVSRR